MSQRQQPLFRAGGAAGLHFIAAAVLALPAAQVAAQAAVPAVPVAAVVNVDVPAQPLDTALNLLARQAGVQLLAPPALVLGRTAPAVKGPLGVTEAAGRLLQGSGLAARLDGRTLVIERTGQEASLQAVTVTAEAERSGATEGTGSYTARSTNMATRLDLSMRETPQSVSVITRQRLDDQGIYQLSDVFHQTTGMTFSNGGSGASVDNYVYSRGFQVGNFQVDGNSRITNTALSLFSVSDTFLYDRIEVIRGAAGLMTGVGEPGATVNMVRKRPTADFQGAVNLSLGRWDHGRAEVDLSAPLNESGSVRGRVLAAWQENGSQLDWGKDRRKTLGAIVEADLAPQTLLAAGATFQQYRSDGASRTGRPMFDVNGQRVHWKRSDASGARWAYAVRNDYSIFGSLEHRFDNGWRVKGSLSRDRSEADNWIGYASQGRPDMATGAGVGLWAARWVYEPEQTTLSVEAGGPFHLFGREHEAALGATAARTRDERPGYNWWYFDDWSPWIDNIHTWDGHTPARPDNPSTYREASDERRNSVYASVRLRPADRWSVILGSRVTDWKETFCNRPNAGAASCRLRKESGELTPYAALVYDLGEQWSLYGSYTNIFKPQNNRQEDGAYLAPLLGNSYEIGGKGELFNGRLNVSAAFYRIEQDNYAVALPDVYVRGTTEQAYRPASGTTTEGYELEVSGAIHRNWQVGAGYAHNKVRDRDGVALNTQIPTNTVKLFTSHHFPSVGKGLMLGGGLRWQNRTWSRFASVPGSPVAEQSAYAVVDLSARYSFTDKLALQVNLYNVLDKRYQTVSSSSYSGEARNLRTTLQMTF